MNQCQPESDREWGEADRNASVGCSHNDDQEKECEQLDQLWRLFAAAVLAVIREPGFAFRYPATAARSNTVDLTGLSADQQMQAGLFCGNVFLTLTSPLTICAPSQFGTTRVTIPAPGTENDDKNPPRIALRNLFESQSATTIFFAVTDTNGVCG